ARTAPRGRRARRRRDGTGAGGDLSAHHRTSVAAAHVSGVAALLIERHPSVDSATVLEVLTSTAKKLSPKGHDDQFGWGLIDPASALAELDSRMADSKVASAARPAAPKQATAKPATQTQAAPKLSPASAQ